MRTPRAVFALYHLGIDARGQYRFRNVDQCAKECGVDRATFQAWLQEYGLTPEDIGELPYDLAAWSARAQFTEPGQVADVVEEAWAALAEARSRRHPGRFHHSVDYDDVWQDRLPSGDIAACLPATRELPTSRSRRRPG
jgi:hypothetical protein